jgi:hypothetical protein
VSVLVTEEDLLGLETSGMTRKNRRHRLEAFMSVRPYPDPNEGSY